MTAQDRDIEVQRLIDDVLVIYEQIVLTDVNGETVDLYLHVTRLVEASNELKRGVERVMFGG